MDMLRSSILGKEFINYRKYTSDNERLKFYRSTINKNEIPVIVDSVDENIIEIFRKKYFINDIRIIKYGLELKMDKDSTVKDILKEIQIELLRAGKEKIFIENNIYLGLENGDILKDMDEKVIKIYKKNRNENDKILYILITYEETIYNYIMSIIRYIIKIFV
jgi:hypothetical protein